MTEQELWKRTITQLKYASTLLKDCTDACTKAMHASQDAVILLENARELLKTNCTKCPLNNLEDL